MTKHKEAPTRTQEPLSEPDLKKIDAALLENTSQHWSKMYRIVLTTMIERGDGITGLSPDFYCDRIAGLVRAGALEARGDLADMHQSEIRLAEQKP